MYIGNDWLQLPSTIVCLPERLPKHDHVPCLPGAALPRSRGPKKGLRDPVESVCPTCPRIQRTGVKVPSAVFHSFKIRLLKDERFEVSRSRELVEARALAAWSSVGRCERCERDGLDVLDSLADSDDEIVDRGFGEEDEVVLAVD